MLQTYYDQILQAQFAYFEDEAESAGPISAPATPSSGRVDPYQLIHQSRTAELRVEVELHISQRSPFSYSGTVPFISADDLHADVVQAPFLPVAGRKGPGGTASRLRVTRAGRLRRKDDTLDGGRKAGNRKWREYGVVLSGSQLLFFVRAALGFLGADRSARCRMGR